MVALSLFATVLRVLSVIVKLWDQYRNWGFSVLFSSMALACHKRHSQHFLSHNSHVHIRLTILETALLYPYTGRKLQVIRSFVRLFISLQAKTYEKPPNWDVNISWVGRHYDRQSKSYQTLFSSEKGKGNGEVDGWLLWLIGWWNCGI